MTNAEIFYEATPNPHAMKFNITKVISAESAFFDDPQKSTRSPLAQKLFGFPWMESLFIGPNFVTVTKQDWVEWSVLADPLSDLILEHITNEEPILLAATIENADEPARSHSAAIEISPDDSPVVQKIKQVLNGEIRPAVAMDGGDILFSRYQDGRLYLRLQGSCSGCPSSMMTLKDGVEVRLKEVVPDLIEVIAE